MSSAADMFGGLGNMNLDDMTKDLKGQMAKQAQQTLEQMRQMQIDNTKQVQAARDQLLNRKKHKLDPEQAAKWAEIEKIIFECPQFIEPLGMTLAGLMRANQDVDSIIKEFPDLRFQMVEFLRQQAAARRGAGPAPDPAQPAEPAQPPPA